MTTLQEKIQLDWMQAMKTRSKHRDTLSLMRNELKNRAIADRTSSHSTEVADDIALEVLTKMAKQRKEAIEQFKAGNRDDLVARENDELVFIESYLPQQMTEDELRVLVEKTIGDLNVTSPKEMGKVMQAVLAQVKGRADGKLVSALVTKLLSK